MNVYIMDALIILYKGPKVNFNEGPRAKTKELNVTLLSQR